MLNSTSKSWVILTMLLAFMSQLVAADSMVCEMSGSADNNHSMMSMMHAPAKSETIPENKNKSQAKVAHHGMHHGDMNHSEMHHHKNEHLEMGQSNMRTAHAKSITKTNPEAITISTVSPDPAPHNTDCCKVECKCPTHGCTSAIVFIHVIEHQADLVFSSHKIQFPTFPLNTIPSSSLYRPPILV